MKKDNSILQQAARRRVESAGKPAYNLTYTTMQLVMAEAARQARRRKKQAMWLGIAAWALGIAACIATIVFTCGKELLTDFSSLWQSLSNPGMWSSPGGRFSIFLATAGTIVMAGAGVVGTIYERLMTRALSRK